MRSTSFVIIAENSRKFADRRIDVAPVGRDHHPKVVRDDAHVLDDRLEPLLALRARRGTGSGSWLMSLMSTSMSRASLVIWSNVTGTSPLIVESVRQRAAPPTGPGTSSTYFSPRSPRFATAAEAPCRRSTSGLSISRSTIAPLPFLAQVDLRDLADAERPRSGPSTSRPGRRRP